MTHPRSGSAALAIGGILVLLLLAGMPTARATHGDPLAGPYGGSLRVGVQGPISLNPFTATDATSWKVIPLVYDALARIDPITLQPTPWAAASWSISGSTLTVTLRSALQFHDGSAETAADVVSSYNQYKTAGMVPADLTVSGSGSTVTFSSATGGGVLYGQGLTLPIVKSGSSSSPVGGGPWRPPASVSMPLTLTANAAHFSPPYLESVTFSRYADVTAAATALLSGNLDFIGWLLAIDDPGIVVNVGGVNKTLLADANLIRNPGLTQLSVGFNMNPARPMSEDVLRLALAKVLDPPTYARFFSPASVSRSPVIEENSPWYNPDVPVYQVRLSGIGTPDVTESLQLLDAAGYVDRDGDGYKEAPDGSKVSISVVGVPQAEDARSFSVQAAVATNFQRLGLKVSVDPEPGASLFSRLAAGNFDAFVAPLETTLDPGFLTAYLKSGAAKNYFRVSDSTLTGYVQSADAALNAASRKAAVDQIQLRTMTRAFFLPQFHVPATEASVRGVFDGWVNMPGGVNNFWTYQWLHAAHVGDLRADLTLVPDSATSGGTTTAIARVFDQNGAPVAGATVTFWIGGAQVASGTTTAGSVQQTLTAPDVEGATDMDVQIVASKLGYTATTVSATMTVHPSVRALSVAVSSSAITIASGGQATITVSVTAGGSAVSGAQVSLEVIGQGGTVAATGGATVQGVFTTTFSGDVGPRTQFRIVATASASGYTDGTGSTTVVVEQRVGSVEPRALAGLDYTTIIVAVFALVVIAAVAAMMRRKK